MKIIKTVKTTILLVLLIVKLDITAQNSLGEGLVAYYPFTQAALDMTGHGYNAIVANPILVEDRFKSENDALNFDGVSDYISFGNVLNEEFCGSNKTFSFSFWIKPNGSIQNNFIIGKSTESSCGSFGRQFMIKVDSSNRLSFIWFTSSTTNTNYRKVSTTSNIDASSTYWNHIIVTYDGQISTNNGQDRVKIYINKILQPTTLIGVGALSDIPIGSSHFSIGAPVDENGIPCSNSYFNGVIDDVRVYNRCVFESEINLLHQETPYKCRKIYNGNFELLNESGFVKYWSPSNTTSLISVSQSNSFEGINSIVINDTSSILAAGLISNRIYDINPGYIFEISSQYYLESGSSKIILEYWNEFDQLIDEVLLDLIVMNNWNMASIIDEVPIGTSYSTIHISSSETNVGICYFDNISFETIVNVESKVQLFVDDYLIDSTLNIYREIHQAEKTPEPLITRETNNPWEGNLCLYGSVIIDDGLFRMYYRNTNNGQYFLSYAESEDGLNWIKPDLQQYSYNGNLNNNIIEIASYTPILPNGGFEIATVIKRPNDYIMLTYVKHQNKYKSFVSNDGLNWSLQSQGGGLIQDPLPNSSDVMTMSYDEYNEEYIVCYKIFNQATVNNDREISITSSNDLENFSESKKMIALADHIDIQGLENVNSYGLGLFPYEGVYIGFNWMFYIENDGGAGTLGGDIGPIDVQLVFSRDLSDQFIKPTRTPIIPNGNSGSWDEGMLFTASFPLIVDDEVWMYYGAYNNVHYSSTNHASIGLSKWRLDGFASLNSEEQEGEIVTKKIIFDGKYLLINADASNENSEIRVEILNDNNLSYPNFGKVDCDIIQGDKIKSRVSWGGEYDLSGFIGDTISIKIYSRNAKIYSLEFDNFYNSTSEFPAISSTIEKIHLYPNPTTGVIIVEGMNNANKSLVSVFSISGQLLFKKIISSDNQTIDISNYDGGIYLIKVESQKDSQFVKVIKI